MRERNWGEHHYGIRVGDRVEERAFRCKVGPAIVLWLYPFNNNRIRVELDTGEKTFMIPEYCHLVE